MCSRFSWLSQFARAFRISGNDVKIIYSPEEFYKALKVRPIDYLQNLICAVLCLILCLLHVLFQLLTKIGVQSAQKRVMFSSLYLGIGKRERDLV